MPIVRRGAIGKPEVKRSSFATYLFRAAMTGLIQAATEAKENGTFETVDKTFTSAELNKFLLELVVGCSWVRD